MRGSMTRYGVISYAVTLDERVTKNCEVNSYSNFKDGKLKLILIWKSDSFLILKAFSIPVPFLSWRHYCTLMQTQRKHLFYCFSFGREELVFICHIPSTHCLLITWVGKLALQKQSCLFVCFVIVVACWLAFAYFFFNYLEKGNTNWEK